MSMGEKNIIMNVPYMYIQVSHSQESQQTSKKEMLIVSHTVEKYIM